MRMGGIGVFTGWKGRDSAAVGAPFCFLVNMSSGQVKKGEFFAEFEKIILGYCILE